MSAAAVTVYVKTMAGEMLPLQVNETITNKQFHLLVHQHATDHGVCDGPSEIILNRTVMKKKGKKKGETYQQVSYNASRLSPKRDEIFCLLIQPFPYSLRIRRWDNGTSGSDYTKHIIYEVKISKEDEKKGAIHELFSRYEPFYFTYAEPADNTFSWEDKPDEKPFRSLMDASTKPWQTDTSRGSYIYFPEKVRSYTLETFVPFLFTTELDYVSLKESDILASLFPAAWETRDETEEDEEEEEEEDE